MSIVAIDIDDIAEAQYIKLRLTTSASGVDWKEDWPGDAAADKADEDEYLEESQEEITIKGVVLEDEVVGKSFSIG